MKKVMLIWIVFISVSVLTGLVFATDAPVDEVAALRAELAKAKDEIHDLKYGNIPPITQQIKPAPADWKGAYGDTQNTQIYFNIKFALADIELCKRAIRLLADTITDITNPDDPNSLVSRMAMLEADFVTKYMQDEYDDSAWLKNLSIYYGRLQVLEEKVADMPVIERLDGLPFGLNTVDSPALKPDDPKEVAKKKSTSNPTKRAEVVK